MEANGHPFLGLAEREADAIAFRKSLLMLASNFLVGTRFNSSRFCFASNGGLLMTLVDVINLFDTDDKCRELLVRLRWPSGVECLRCKGPVAELATAKQLFYCKACDYQFTVTASTIFNDSHLPLQKWFLATLLLCEARKGMSANQIKRTLGVRLQDRMVSLPSHPSCYEGSRSPHDGRDYRSRRNLCGRQSSAAISAKRDSEKATKQIVIGIRQRGGDLRFFHAQDANLAHWQSSSKRT